MCEAGRGMDCAKGRREAVFVVGDGLEGARCWGCLVVVCGNMTGGEVSFMPVLSIIAKRRFGLTTGEWLPCARFVVCLSIVWPALLGACQALTILRQELCRSRTVGNRVIVTPFNVNSFACQAAEDMGSECGEKLARRQ